MRPKDILRKLKTVFPHPKRTTSKDDFETLIATIISQNTNDKNTARAFENLSRRFPITPGALSEANVEEVEKAIRVAGLFRNKSRVIKKISRLVLKKHHGSLDFIHSKPLEEARITLMSFPGVGPKTADVVLLFCAEKPTIPIDTHVNRTSKRLGLAPKNGDYEEVRRALQSIFPSKEYFFVHTLLISLGRECCKAGKPLCPSCPLNAECPSKQEE